MWRFTICALIACKGDAAPSQPPQPPPPPPGHVRVPVVSSSLPAIVAVRDDAGTAWRTLAVRDQAYDVPISPRFTLVVVCAQWTGSEVEIRHWTAGDNLDFVIACEGFDGEALADVTPVFAPGGAVQTVKAGGLTEICASNVPLCSLRAGTRDILVLHDPESDAVRAKLVRGVSIFDAARIDADASRGWEPERRTLEITSGDHARFGAVNVCLETPTGDALLCSRKTHDNVLPLHIRQTYLRVPDAVRVPGDCDVLDVLSTRMCLPDAPHTRVEIQSREVTMRIDDTSIGFSIEDADALAVDVSGGRRAARWQIIATKRWLAGATTYTIPDLAIAGWRAEWSRSAEPFVTASLVWGPKPSSHRKRPRLWQRLAPGDRMDTVIAGRGQKT